MSSSTLTSFDSTVGLDMPNAFDDFSIEYCHWHRPVNSFKEALSARQRDERPQIIAASLRSFAEDAAMLTYFHQEWEHCHEWAVTAARECAYYLMGDWKTREVTKEGTIDPASWFEGKKSRNSWEIWIDDALGWAGVAHAWSEASQLLSFPQESIGIDPDGPAARAYYLGLAPWWRDRQDTSGLEDAKQVRGAGSKQCHLQCDIALAISERDESQLQKAFPKAVRHFLKRRDHNEQFPMAATFLWHVAKKDGLEVELEPEVGKFLFQLPDSYWAEKDN